MQQGKCIHDNMCYMQANILKQTCLDILNGTVNDFYFKKNKVSIKSGIVAVMLLQFLVFMSQLYSASSGYANKKKKRTNSTNYVFIFCKGEVEAVYNFIFSTF